MNIQQLHYYDDAEVHFIVDGDRSYLCTDIAGLILEMEDCGYSKITEIMYDSKGFIDIAIENRMGDFVEVLNDYFDSYPMELETYLQELSYL